jgi:hypothetical protein
LVGREQKGQVQLCPEYGFTYDDLGRVTEIDNGATPDAPKVVLTMAYNSASRRTSLAAEIANTDDFLNTNQYDNVGRMTLVDQDEQSGGNSVSEKRVDFESNDLGQYTEITRYADVAGTLDVATSFYTYDDANHLTDLDHKQGATNFRCGNHAAN